MKKNSNLLARGKKVALVVLLATMMASCGQTDNNVKTSEYGWEQALTIGFFGAAMYILGYGAGRYTKRK
ncbi:MAG: hypothetical protein J6W08_03375 [Alphaproteobacteria bacterium]|nr:hypothetical protein [Alphaproteobacteria bacterium]